MSPEPESGGTVDGVVPVAEPVSCAHETCAPSVDPTPSEGCPPPLRCRHIAAALDSTASAWELDDSPLGTRGWCWGSGPPLYFLNPLGGSARLFALTAWLLREDFRCMLVDWPSPRAGVRADLDLFAKDLQLLAESAGDSQIAVFGSSFGGAVALRSASMSPGLVDRLIVQGAAQVRHLSIAERVLAWGALRSRRTVRELPFSAQVLRINHSRWFPPLDPDRWQWFLDLIGEFPVSLLATQALALHNVDLAPDLRRIECPVLVLDTEGAGPRARQDQAALRAHLAQGYAASMHTTGLYPYLTHPHRLVKLIRQFVADPAAMAAASSEPSSFALRPT